MPKFRMEESFDLNAALEKLGMTDMFIGGRANFSKMTRIGGLYVSKVIHKAFIEVRKLFWSKVSHLGKWKQGMNWFISVFS